MLLKRIGWAVAALLLVAAVAAGLFAWRALNPPLPDPLASYAALPLQHADGSTTTLAGEAAATVEGGRPTVLSFWASWCAPCRQEARALAALRRSTPAERLNILYVNADPNDTPAMIARFLGDANAADLPWLRGSAATYEAIADQSSLILPRTYLFDRAGRAARVLTGYAEGQTEAELAAAVAALLR